MQQSMKLTENAYDRVESGKKTIEIRLFDEKRQKLNIGDIIEFSKLPELKDKIKVKVIELHKYKTFRDLVTDYGTEYYGHQKDKYSVDEFVERCYTTYSKEQEQKYGVLGIEIKLIS